MAVYVIGGGLAGCEAAWQIAQAGIKVKLFEMKPVKFSEAHSSENLAELVCSNSLKATNIENASGLLKEEMRCLGGMVIGCADESAVPAGGNHPEFCSSSLLRYNLNHQQKYEFAQFYYLKRQHARA